MERQSLPAVLEFHVCEGHVSNHRVKASLGPFRPFLLLYFACGAANRFRYQGHPMEEDAYVLAGRPRISSNAAVSSGLAPSNTSVGRARGRTCSSPRLIPPQEAWA